MKIGVLLAIYGDQPREFALDAAASHGLDAVEFGAGNYPGSPHLDPVQVVRSDEYADRLLHDVESRGLTISALSCHGNPLHPDRGIAAAHDLAFRDTCEAAARLGVDTVNLFSGCPGDWEGGRTPNWITCPWPTEFTELYQWQWHEVAIPYWTEAASFARDAGISKLAFEMHPGMIVYNPATLLRLREAAGDAIGANFDPSHLFWQGIDIGAVIRLLGRHRAIFHVHAKDTYVDHLNVQVNGWIDPNSYSDIANRAWTFRTVGYGHGEEVWRQIISDLRLAGYDGTLSIEHEDALMSVEEGLTRAVEMLKRCRMVDPPATAWWT
jgi:sugar phosphate isomerase/epimerase